MGFHDLKLSIKIHAPPWKIILFSNGKYILWWKITMLLDENLLIGSIPIQNFWMDYWRPPTQPNSNDYQVGALFLHEIVPTAVKPSSCWNRARVCRFLSLKFFFFIIYLFFKKCNDCQDSKAEVASFLLDLFVWGETDEMAWNRLEVFLDLLVWRDNKWSKRDWG